MQKPLSDATLKKILETANERDLFIVGHMYIENMIDRILEKKFNIPSKSIDSTLFTLNLKNGYIDRLWPDLGKCEEKC